jgi:cytochrome P450
LIFFRNLKKNSEKWAFLKFILWFSFVLDVTVPKGCILNLFIFAMHRDPEVFPNPDKFEPDRFLDKESSLHGPFDYVPFSAGPRNCIGKHITLKARLTLKRRFLRVIFQDKNSL